MEDTIGHIETALIVSACDRGCSLEQPQRDCSIEHTRRVPDLNYSANSIYITLHTR